MEGQFTEIIKEEINEKKKKSHRKYGAERDGQNEERPIKLEGRMD